MKALSVLFGGRLSPEAFEKVFPSNGAGKESAFSLSLHAASMFSGTQKIVFLGMEGENYPLPPEIELCSRPFWNKKNLMEELSRLSGGEFHIYFAWADSPLLDPELAAKMAERHIRYGAEYSYADGWPYGFAPEILSPGTAGILAKIAETDESAVERDALFQLIQKDINSFDIETEISPVDLRPWRLSMTADSKRNLLLLSRFLEAGFSSSKDAENFISQKPELLRTLPAFFNIQVSGACPQACTLCPWPLYGLDKNGAAVTDRNDYMPKEAFSSLLDKIVDFAGDAVIDISLWGEIALHPEKMELIEMVLSRPALSLIIETSGIGWKTQELETLAKAALTALPRLNNMAPLSWIVSLDAHDSLRYREVRGPGFSEAHSCARTLLSLFPKDLYVQAVRVKGQEDDIENFYRSWKAESPSLEGKHIIIQKYNDFAGVMPKLKASDLSPVKRRSCWHIKRDFYILLDGRVPCCREDLAALKNSSVMGNALEEELSLIWERGMALYQKHCKLEGMTGDDMLNENFFSGICDNCDEYYTFNF